MFAAFTCSLLLLATTTQSTAGPVPLMFGKTPVVVQMSRAELTLQAEYCSWAREVLGIHQHNATLTWFRGWRRSKVSEEYAETAKTFEEGAAAALKAKSWKAYRLLNRAAASYNLIAEMVTLGGSETVNDGTGHYTALIAKKIEDVRSSIFMLEEETEQLLAK